MAGTVNVLILYIFVLYKRIEMYVSGNTINEMSVFLPVTNLVKLVKVLLLQKEKNLYRQ
jgi:hypothetical protein